VTAHPIARRLAELGEAGSKLRRRPVHETLEALSAVLEGWRGEGSPWRRALEAELPEATGFSAPVVAEGLRLGLESWSGEKLLDLVAREIGPGDPLGAAGASMVSGFDTTAVFLAGAIPMPTLLALVAPLALRSPVLAKVASRDPVTAHHVARSIAECDPLLGQCVDCVEFTRGDGDSADALLMADCVVASGSDETVAAVGARVRPPRRLVTYGHRLSVSVLGSAALRGSRLLDAAARLALDVALWDQQGCLSPVAAYVVDASTDAADAFAEALAGALADVEERLPRGAIDKATAARISQERADAELRGAAGARVAVHAGAGSSWTVVREDTPVVRPAPLHRFVRVLPASDGAALIDALDSLGPYLAAAAVEGFDAETPALARRLADLGASRICAFGAMQRPPLAWRHDNRGVLTPLARFADLEATR
jgi:hypothetical protein